LYSPPEVFENALSYLCVFSHKIYYIPISIELHRFIRYLQLYTRVRIMVYMQREVMASGGFLQLYDYF